MITETGKFELKPYTKKELANLYNMPVKAFESLLKQHQDIVGKKKGWYYNIHQVESILKCIGFPRTIQVNNERNLLEFV